MPVDKTPQEVSTEPAHNRVPIKARVNQGRASVQDITVSQNGYGLSVSFSWLSSLLAATSVFTSVVLSRRTRNSTHFLTSFKQVLTFTTSNLTKCQHDQDQCDHASMLPTPTSLFVSILEAMFACRCSHATMAIVLHLLFRSRLQAERVADTRTIPFKIWSLCTQVDFSGDVVISLFCNRLCRCMISITRST